MNKIFNGYIYLVLDWLDIFVIVCGTWCGLSKGYIIVWSYSASYL